MKVSQVKTLEIFSNYYWKVIWLTDLTDSINAHVSTQATLIALGSVNYSVHHLIWEILIHWATVQFAWIYWKRREKRREEKFFMLQAQTLYTETLNCFQIKRNSRFPNNNVHNNNNVHDHGFQQTSFIFMGFSHIIDCLLWEVAPESQVIVIKLNL